MQEEKAGAAAIDLVRWTFAVQPDQTRAVEQYLADQGAEVVVTSEGQVTATWEEPEGDLDEVIDELWAVIGTPVEITHEEFKVVNRLVYDAEEDDAETEAKGAA